MPIKVLVAFGVRGSSLRARLILKLAEKLGEQVPFTTLLSAVYGSETGSKHALSRVIDGVMETIKRNHLPYKLVKQRSGKDVSLGLHEVKQSNPSQQERSKVA
jgi:hypothetical protein